MADKTPSTIKELAKAFADFEARFNGKEERLKEALTKVIEKELESVKGSLKFINEKFEEFKTEIVTLKKDFSSVKEDNRHLKQENNRLVKELKEVRSEVVDLQQYSRKTNLEIKGVPSTQDENLLETMQAICSSLKEDITEADIEVIHRVPTKDKTKSNIIVKFASLKYRNRVLLAAKKCRLNTSALGFVENDPIFINEHLCPANKLLLGKALAAKREKNWKYTWVSDGKILMRKAEKTKVLHVTCAEDLNRVV